jgi:hypothetical protein
MRPFKTALRTARRIDLDLELMLKRKLVEFAKENMKIKLLVNPLGRLWPY